MSEQRDFRLLLLSSLVTFGSFGLLLPVVPLWAETGGAGPAGVGATNFAFLGMTAVAQLAAPRTLRLVGHRESLALGGVLLGLPVFAYPLTTALPALVAVSALRGVGFALIVVTGVALVAHLLPAHRRGRGVGVFGMAVAMPNVVCLPAGPWLAENLSFPLVFTVGGVLPLAGAVVVLSLRVRTRVRGRTGRVDRERAVRFGDIAAPAVVVAAVSVATSVYLTFLPVAITGAGAVTAGLLGYSIGTLVGRWLGGEVGHRHGRPTLLVPGMVACGAGVLALLLTATTDDPAVRLAASATSGAVFGLGLGAVQTATLTAMFDRVSTRGYDIASTAWNMSLDAGTGLGSLALALVPAIAVSRGASRTSPQPPPPSPG